MNFCFVLFCFSAALSSPPSTLGDICLVYPSFPYTCTYARSKLGWHEVPMDRTKILRARIWCLPISEASLISIVTSSATRLGRKVEKFVETRSSRRDTRSSRSFASHLFVGFKQATTYIPLIRLLILKNNWVTPPILLVLYSFQKQT